MKPLGSHVVCPSEEVPGRPHHISGDKKGRPHMDSRVRFWWPLGTANGQTGLLFSWAVTCSPHGPHWALTETSTRDLSKQPCLCPGWLLPDSPPVPWTLVFCPTVESGQALQRGSASQSYLTPTLRVWPCHWWACSLIPMQPLLSLLPAPTRPEPELKDVSSGYDTKSDVL